MRRQSNRLSIYSLNHNTARNNAAHWLGFQNVFVSGNLEVKEIFDSTLQFRTNFVSEFIGLLKINQNIFGNTPLPILRV